MNLYMNMIRQHCEQARLIDIDDLSVVGGAKELPALAVELATLLPLLVQKLLLGKGRGSSFVSNEVSRIRRAACQSGQRRTARG